MKIFNKKKDKAKNRKLFVVALLAIIAVVGAYVFLPKSGKVDLVPQKDLFISVPPLDASTLAIVGIEKNIFSKSGLHVVISDLSFGEESFNNLVSGQSHIIVVSDASIADAMLKHIDFVVLGTLHKAKQNVQLIGLKSRGITTLHALEGKKIGVIKGDVGEFFLSELLNHLSLSMADVDLQYGTLVELQQKLKSGELDAIALRRRYVYELSTEFGDDAFVTSGNDNYSATYSLVTTPEWLAENQETAQTFLNDLVSTSDYVQSHKSDTISLVSKQLGVEKQFLDSIWDSSSYELSADFTVNGLVDAEIRYFSSGNTVKFDPTTTSSYFDYTLLKEVLKSVAKPSQLQQF
ncbi:ABC transporter substrate-binding protein [Candidatus Woesebacteria bacterium]|nr:ABC transporter substrate-binding protein [Candidatus Woesebacteria bacterium]